MARLSNNDFEGIRKGVNSLKKKGEAVVKAAKALKSATASTEAASETEFDRALGEWKSEAASLEKYSADGGFSVADFLKQIGEGVVAGQQELDDGTQRYLAGLPEHAQPTTFRIPKLKAELHFAMETAVEHKLNVFMFGRSREQRASQQHKIDFEIVAAPPPPAMLEKLAGIPLTGAVVTNLIERESVLARVEKLRETGSDDSALNHAISAILANRPKPAQPRDLTIVLFGVKSYILILPLATVDKLHLVTMPESESDPAGARGAELEIPPSGAILVKWLREVSRKQADSLSEFRARDA